MLHKVIVHLAVIGLFDSKSCGNCFVTPPFGSHELAFGVKKDGVRWPALLPTALLYLTGLGGLP